MDDSIKKQDIKCDIMEKLEEQVFKISRLIFKEVTGDRFRMKSNAIWNGGGEGIRITSGCIVS